MINVKTSNDPRAGIQNGFWAIKFIIIIGGMIGSFFIPVGTFGKYPRNVRVISRHEMRLKRTQLININFYSLKVKFGCILA